MQNQALTTHERALLKAIQGAVIGFFVALVPQVFFILAAGGSLNLTRTAINTLLTAFALAILKLWAAQSDAHLGAVIDAYSQAYLQKGVTELSTTQPGAIQITLPSPPIVQTIVQDQAPTQNVATPVKSQFVPTPGVSTIATTGPMPVVKTDQADPAFDHRGNTDPHQPVVPTPTDK